MHDDDAFFLFHVDRKAPKVLEELKQWLNEDSEILQRCNHAIMQNQWDIKWGN